MRNRLVRAMLPGFVVEHWLDVSLLDHRCDWQRDKVWSVSVGNNG
jgi:hypothetical protein